MSVGETARRFLAVHAHCTNTCSSLATCLYHKTSRAYSPLEWDRIYREQVIKGKINKY